MLWLQALGDVKSIAAGYLSLQTDLGMTRLFEGSGDSRLHVHSQVLGREVCLVSFTLPKVDVHQDS